MAASKCPAYLILISEVDPTELHCSGAGDALVQEACYYQPPGAVALHSKWKARYIHRIGRH